MKYGSEIVDVLFALQRANHLVLGALADRLKHLRLSAAELNLLANLATAQPQPVGGLARAVGARSSTLTGVLDRLAGRDLVTRDAHPGDRRSVLIHLTETGRAAADEVIAAYRDLAGRAVSGLPAGALAGYREVLGALSGAHPAHPAAEPVTPAASS